MNESRIFKAVDARRATSLSASPRPSSATPPRTPPAGEREVAQVLREVIDRYSLGDTVTIASDPERAQRHHHHQGPGPRQEAHLQRPHGCRARRGRRAGHLESRPLRR